MLGKPTAPELKAKAAETRGMLPFVVEVLARYLHKFAAKGGEVHLCAQFLHGAGVAALEYEAIQARNSRDMPRADSQALLDVYLRFATLCHRAGLAMTPKHHQVPHMIGQSVWHGNPKSYATYRDESMNGVIARIARMAQRKTFYVVAHTNFHYLLQTDWTSAMY